VLRRHASGRNVLIGLGVVLALVLIFDVLLMPAYRAVSSGFDPMDVQFPLTREMVAIQRGAFGPGIQAAYLQFAAVDFVFPLANAVFFALLWSWLAAKGPHPLIERSFGHGLLALPFVAALIDWAENVGFLMLVFADPHDPLHDVTVATLAVHRAKFVMVTVNNVLTVLIAALAATRWLRARKRT
jgi:hypothetical protein